MYQFHTSRTTPSPLCLRTHTECKANIGLDLCSVGTVPHGSLNSSATVISRSLFQHHIRGIATDPSRCQTLPADRGGSKEAHFRTDTGQRHMLSKSIHRHCFCAPDRIFCMVRTRSQSCWSFRPDSCSRKRRRRGLFAQRGMGRSQTLCRALFPSLPCPR